MGKSKALFLVACVTPGLMQSAWAADLYIPPPAPQPPRMEMPGQNLFATVDGYYLRGDIGVGLTQHTVTSAFTLAVPDARFDSSSISDSTFVRLGFGRQFGTWIRSDLTFEYRGSSTISATESYNQGAFFTPPSTIRGYDSYSGHISHGVFMLNGYADLGTWQRISPFVGFGLGYALHRVPDLKDTGGVSAINSTSYGIGGFGFANANTSSSLAWAGTAGLGYQVNENLKLEVGYRYLNLGTSKSGAIKCLTQPASTCANEVQSYKISSHDFSLGMRWMLGGSVNYQQQAKFEMNSGRAKPTMKMAKETSYEAASAYPNVSRNNYAAAGPAEIDPRIPLTTQSTKGNSGTTVIPLLPETNELSKADLPAQTAKGKKAQPHKSESVSSNTMQITPERLY
ncbi:MAG: porin family protein [Alphaproteobacteria bacterium]|nr:porin family protein [Alphaproteobacteria bacterium]